ncbi:hypothetical protein [Streptomyces incarnatus]|uniref:hypothetical protein n=1 Tax=Streptomyces incarnatus TaxID=665007 RepID=UPI000A42BCF1|nr:hypothetical protein [Streptomyces incarnatus]
MSAHRPLPVYRGTVSCAAPAHDSAMVASAPVPGVLPPARPSSGVPRTGPGAAR